MIVSNMIIPLLIVGIVWFGVSRKVPVYDAFIEGANSGFKIVLKIMPTMVALMIAVGILRSSGFNSDNAIVTNLFHSVSD